MATRRALTALDVLAVAAGELSVSTLTEFLSIHAIKDEPYEKECWQVVCDVQNTTERPATVAARHRRAVIEKMPQIPPKPGEPYKMEALIKLVQTYAIKCTYESYADSYVSSVLKAMLPFELTAMVPRDLPPYSHASTYLGAECNDVISPVVKTPLRTVLASANWGPFDLRGFFAAVATLRELTGGHPAVYVNADLAAIKKTDSAVFALSRSVSPGGCGLVHHGCLTFYKIPLHAVCAWIFFNKTEPILSGLISKLDVENDPNLVARATASIDGHAAQAVGSTQRSALDSV